MTKSYQKHFRLDFHTHLERDPETGRMSITLIPRPDRYEWIERDGTRFLYDKLDYTFIPEEVFKKGMVEVLEGAPMYLQRQEIDDSDDYVAGRLESIRSYLDGAREPEALDDPSEAFLNTLGADSELGFAILSLDIAGSTRLSTSLRPSDYRSVIGVTLSELGRIVPLFQGHVLKYTGDGLIAYFPEPSFIRKNDFAVDCALTMKRLIDSGLNSVFQERGFPAIQFRIGIDSGEASVIRLGAANTKQHRDIIGSIVSLSSEIQATAQHGGLRVGETTLRNLHTAWRLMFLPVPLPDEWDYKDETGRPYRLYEFSIAGRAAGSAEEKRGRVS